jgi:hypothetical protein
MHSLKDVVKIVMDCISGYRLRKNRAEMLRYAKNYNGRYYEDVGIQTEGFIMSINAQSKVESVLSCILNRTGMSNISIDCQHLFTNTSALLCHDYVTGIAIFGHVLAYVSGLNEPTKAFLNYVTDVVQLILKPGWLKSEIECA